MARNCTMGSGTPQEAVLFTDAAEEIRGLLHQFAAGFLKSPSEELLRRLAEHEISSARRLAPSSTARSSILATASTASSARVPWAGSTT
jgi:chemosensory pili system protein ChpA (sensor histidine kinase/response regulator)